MLVLPKTIKKAKLNLGRRGWGRDSKYVWNRLFAYYFLIVSVKVHKENTEVKSKGKRALQICLLSCIFSYVPFSFPSLGKYSGRYISCTTWSPWFRTEIAGNLHTESSIQHVKVDTDRRISPTAPGPNAHFSQYLIDFLLCGRNRGLQRQARPRKDLQGVEREGAWLPATEDNYPQD